MDQRLSLVTLGVADVDVARRFYEALGWRGITPPGVPPAETVVFFQAGGMIMGLWSRALLAADSGVADTGADWAGITLAHNVAAPAEVDAVLAEAAAAGATVTRSGAPTPWGGYSGVFRDLDGHTWEVAHNPGWQVADDGSVHLPADV
jgi:uncharacterized protein